MKIDRIIANMQAKQIFDAFQKLKVFVIGDAMIDRYVWGKVERISPEAPVPVLNWQSEEERLGGAANVALNLKALGAEPFLCTVLGKDRDGLLFKKLLPAMGLSPKGIFYSEDRKTTVKSRMMAGGQQLLRVDKEDVFDLSKSEEEVFLQQIEQLLKDERPNVIVLQDYNKGVLSPKVITTILQKADQQNIPVAVDPKFKNFFAYQSCTLFKPNLKEINALLPEPAQANISDLTKADNYLRAKLNHHLTMITLSEKGIFISDGKTAEIVPTTPRNIADVCGAGDTVVSIAALGMAINLPLKDIAILSNLAGGQVCEKPGVVSVDKAQLMEEARGGDISFVQIEGKL